MITDSNKNIAASTVTSTELGYLDGVTSAIQTQLNGKAASNHTHNYAAVSHTHNATQVNGLTVNRALISNRSGQVAVSGVTSTQLGYLSGVTSAIQTQLNGKNPTITYSEMQLVNNYGTLFGYATRISFGSISVVWIRSVFAQNRVTATNWYNVCDLNTNMRPSSNVYAPCVYGGSQYAVTSVRVETSGRFAIYMGSSQDTRDYFTFNFSYVC